MIPRENLRVGDKIKAFVSGVENTNKGSNYLLPEIHLIFN